MAQTAERLGFDGFFRSDHYLVMGRSDGLPGPTDAWITLAGLARETSTIRLGTLVTSASFRYPGPLAIAVAEVDQMSGGRVELGLGAGWYEAEHDACAIPFPSLGERFQRLEEQLAIVSGLWANPIGERFSFTGRHYEIKDFPACLKPLQQPARRSSSAATARPARPASPPATHRVQPGLLAAPGVRRAVRASAAGEAIDRDPSPHCVLGRGRPVLRRTRPSSASRRRHRPRTGRAVRARRRRSGSGGGGHPRSLAAGGRGAPYLQVLDLSDLEHPRAGRRGGGDPAAVTRLTHPAPTR